MKKFINTIYTFAAGALRHYGIFFVLEMLIIMTTKILSQIINPDCDISGGEHYWLTVLITFLLGLADCTLLCLVAWGLQKIRLKYLGYLLIGFCCYMSIVELYTMVIYHTMFTTSVIQLFMETNVRESSEMLVTVFCKLSSWLILVTLCLYTAIGYYVTKNTWRLPQWAKMSCVVFCLLCICVQMNSYTKLWTAFHMQKVSEIQQVSKLPFMHTPMIRLMFGVASHQVSSKEIGLQEQTLKRVRVDSCSFKSPLIVLVIGESHSKFHSSIYNPEGPETMPNMHRLQKDSSLVAFDDVISSSNITSRSFEEMFSTTNRPVNVPKPGDDKTMHALFPTVFQKAGYQVDFMSNQFIINVKEFWSSLGGGALTDSRTSKLLFNRRNTEAYPWDMQLLNCKEFPTNSELTSRPTLLIVHLVGEHVEYSKRHPACYNHFNTGNVHPHVDSPQAREITSDYYNCLLYTDAVLDSLFCRIKNDDAVCIYLSDHGEELYDWRDFFNRSHERPVTKNIALYQYGIPMFVYMTDMYRQKHPDIVSEVRSSSHHPFVSRHLPDLLFHLAGISYKDYDETYDILSPKYNTRRHRIINDNEDYDEIIK